MSRENVGKAVAFHPYIDNATMLLALERKP